MIVQKYKISLIIQNRDKSFFESNETMYVYTFEVTFYLEGLNNGTYFVIIKSASTVSTLKFVKE